MLLTGISYGWEKLPEGGYVYIVQIEPHTLEALKAGQAIQSDLPPNLRGVRSYRITVGVGDVPREGMPELPEETPAQPIPTDPAPIAAPGMPGLLAPDPDSKPAAEQSVYLQGNHDANPAEEKPAEPEESPQPWGTGATAVALALLLGSLSGNFYLCWITWDARSRYRRLLHRLKDERRDLPEYLDLPEMPEGTR
jgi:hypothetical protein